MATAEQAGQTAAGVYIRQLEDAALILWAEMSGEQVKLIREETPALVDFLAHLHDRVEHEQAMTRPNVWATDG
jgi:hypothetical protein